MEKSPDNQDVTGLLLDWSQGDEASLERLMPLVYDELKRVARGHMRKERSDHTLQTTVLVHEAYLRLVDAQRVEWQDRAHFFGIASRLIRQILVDHARTRGAAKRGGGVAPVALDEGAVIGGERATEILALDDALQDLARMDPRQARVVEMRYFGGLTIDETAAVLEISPATVKREWNVASAWLRRELGSGPPAGQGPS